MASSPPTSSSYSSPSSTSSKHNSNYNSFSNSNGLNSNPTKPNNNPNFRQIQHQHHPSNPATRRRAGLPYSSSSSNNFNSSPKPIPPPSAPVPSHSLITVIPPSSLPSNPPQGRPNTSSSAYGPSSRFSRGILIPLYPTLNAQLAAISREYGLPSTGGMVLYLVEGSSHTGEIAQQLAGGPRISDEAWQILWSGVFEDEREEALQNAIQAKELYENSDQDFDPHSHLYPHQRTCLGFDQSTEEEEVLSGGLEELINSGLNFPDPPPNSRPLNSADPSVSSQEEINSNSTRRSTQPSPISSDDFSKFNSLNAPVFHSNGIRSAKHGRSQSSMSNNVHLGRTVRLHSADFPSRPSTSLSTQLPHHRSLRQIGLAYPSIHRAASSDIGSLYSLSSRPRRIGAGTIVGKIEFDIDRTRSCGRWYDLWLNPPSLGRSNPSCSILSLEDHARPLLLPDVIAQRSKSSTGSSNGLRDSHQKQPPLSSNPTESSQPTNSNCSSPSKNKSLSFLPFRSGRQQSESDSIYQGFDSPNCENIFYGNNPDGSSTKQASFPRNSATSVSDHIKKFVNNSAAAIREKRHLGNNNVNEQHQQAMAMVAAQAKHQDLIDEIDAELSTSLDLSHHSFGLTLDVDSHIELADIRYTRNDDLPSSYKFTTQAVHSVSAPTAPSSVIPSRSGTDLVPSKRTSSMAMQNNLDELEQALATLSPRALRFSPVLPPLSAHSTSSSAAMSARAAEPRGSALGLAKSKASSAGSASSDDKAGGGMAKLFDSLQGSFNDLKHRSSNQDIPVGLTEGYTREDLREHRAPLSPALHKRSFSPGLISKIRPNTPTTKKSNDGFVTKAAGIMSGKFRNSGSK